MFGTTVNVAIIVGLVGLLLVYYPGVIFQEKLPVVDKFNSSYSFVIVGGGTAGCVLAARLSEDANVDVLLLEAGGSDLGDYMIDIPGMAAATWGTDIDWTYVGQPQEGVHIGMKDQRVYIPRGRVLGGSSSINAMGVVRGSRHDYDRWANYTGDETWDYSHVLTYFKKLEDMTIPGLRDSPYHGKGGPLKIGYNNGAPLATKLLEAATDLGYAPNDDYNGKTMEGIVRVQSNKNGKHRLSTSHAYLHPALKRENLHLATNAHVQKIVIKDGKAVSVEFVKDGRKHVVHASKEVILSAGAIGSPQILLLSGVGPRKQLERLHIPVVANLPVGENLQDHAAVDVVAGIKQPLSWPRSARTSIWTLIEYTLFGTGILNSPLFLENMLFKSVNPDTKKMDWPDLQLHIFTTLLDTEMADALNMNKKTQAELSHRDQWDHGFTCFPSLIRPESRGNVALSSSDPFDYPIISPQYLASDYDLDILHKGVEECKRLIGSKTLQDIGATLLDTKPIPQCKGHEFESRDYWTCVMKHRTLTIYHHAGTCKMGPDGDQTAVVDSQLRVRGVANLRVVDASIMPWITSANTHIPTVMIAEKAADIIRGKPPALPTVI